MTADETRSRHELEIEVEAEISVARRSVPADELGESPAKWLFDPIDIEREEIGLGSILGALEALERGPDPGHPLT